MGSALGASPHDRAEPGGCRHGTGVSTWLCESDSGREGQGARKGSQPKMLPLVITMGMQASNKSPVTMIVPFLPMH